MVLCNFGCGQEAMFITGHAEYCCSRYPSICPEMLKKIGKIKETQKSLEKHVVKLINEEYYRSVQKVNIPPDMVRVTLSMPKMDWLKLRKLMDVIE